jgi:hypothetical protein
MQGLPGITVYIEIKLLTELKVTLQASRALSGFSTISDYFRVDNPNGPFEREGDVPVTKLKSAPPTDLKPVVPHPAAAR